jgi:hypothetical protein
LQSNRIGCNALPISVTLPDPNRNLRNLCNLRILSSMPAGEGSAFGAIPAKVHRTPAAFTGTRFVHEQALASRVGTEFDSAWIGPGKQINGVPSNSGKHRG